MNILLIVSWIISAVCIAVVCWLLTAKRRKARREEKAIRKMLKRRNNDGIDFSEAIFEHIRKQYDALDEKKRYIFDCFYVMRKVEDGFSDSFAADTCMIDVQLMRTKEAEELYQSLFKEYGEVTSLFQ